MTTKLCILNCHNFHKEVAGAIAAEGWDDVVTAKFPSRCGHPPMSWDELRPLIPQECDQVMVLGRACMSELDESPADFPPTRVVKVEQCFHLVAGQSLVSEAIAGGAYMMTPGWLVDWRGQLQQLGFAPEQASEFFGDFAKELLLLDSGTETDIESRLVELSEAVNLPARRIVVGLDFTRLLLARLVLEWRLDKEQQSAKISAQQHAGELADRIAAMDMLTGLAKTQNEDEAIGTIRELFQMLFAPAALHYLRIENDIPLPEQGTPAEMLDSMRTLGDEYALMPDGKGFLLRIGRDDAMLGVIAVDGLSFPQYRDRYLNMALVVTGVCGLAIENARNRRKLIEAAKMASLGIMVAGVAHEINTPLGVGLTAASTLQKQGSDLARRFAEQSMTQSDLERYLESAESSSRLILDNLARIGHLIDTFRHVAVDGDAIVAKQTFGLKDCIDEVIRSLGDRLPAERITIDIQCDPILTIKSLRGDWATIFINLIDNSVRHGFRGREHGMINITVVSDAKKLQLEYRDDGVGLAPESLARIFDPFFSSDLQHGMGLGMYLVYNLISHRMGGDIQCESVLGQGVHFYIEVPQ